MTGVQGIAELARLAQGDKLEPSEWKRIGA